MSVLRSAALMIFFLWLAIDSVVVFRHKTGAPENRDRLSLKVLVIGGPLVWLLSIYLAFVATGAMHSTALQSAGLAIMAFGIFVRFTAIAQLGRFHTPNVAVLGDHQLKQTGLYRYVRHPSYLGALIAFVGFGLALGNWLSLAVLAVATPCLYLFRIHEEDAALLAAFGEPYRDYCRGTKRLIPGLY